MYIDNTTSNQTTGAFSTDNIFLSNIACQSYPTSCAKLITNELKGVVCVDQIKNLVVST